jgi:hypothetical protein
MTSISDLSDSMSVGQTLSTPLLRNLLEHERDEHHVDYIDEKGDTCALKIIVSNEELDEVSGDDSSSQLPCWWNGNYVAWFAWVALPALLFLQFGRVFCMSGAEATATGLRWSVVNYAIVLFVIISMANLYRHAIKDYQLTYTAVLLLPEIFIYISLGLVIFDQLYASVLLMLWSILCLAIVVVAISIRDLIATTSSSAEEDGGEQLQDKLDVSFFNGGRVPTTKMV